MKNLVKTMQNWVPLVHAILLFCGITIGAGMVTFPIVTAHSGVVGSISLYVICWFFSVWIGLILLEVLVWMDTDSHFVSISKELLGWFACVIVSLLFIFLFYFFMTVVISGSSSIIQNALPPIFPTWLPPIIVSIIIGHILHIGIKGVCRVNLHIVLGTLTTFIGFLWVGFQEFHLSYLFSGTFGHLLSGLPIVFIAFCYQGLIPSIYYFLEQDFKKTRLCILIGTTIPLIAYILWDLLIKGIVPMHGPESLGEAKLLGQSLMEPLSFLLPGSPIIILGTWFAFFGFTTSLLGTSLSLSDFFSDALDRTRLAGNRLGLVILTFLPPTLATLINPDRFVLLLNLFGGVLCSLLFAIFPLLAIFKGKFLRGMPTQSNLLTHWLSLLMLLIFTITLMYVEIKLIISNLS
jgi:tyrosine-specific transport protein